MSKWFTDSKLAVNHLLLTFQPYLGFVFCTRLSQDFVSLMRWLQFHSFRFFKSYITASLHLFFGRPLVLTPVGFHSAIFLTNFISSFMLRCPHNFILCAFVYWTLSALFICSYLVLLILHPSLHWIDPNIFLNICLSKTNKLFMSRTDSVQVLHAYVTTSLINIM
jgi:hypothetical protein